ncbi:MAG TPA: peptide ABC transporter, partial [Firmicutes bacterium]|nr:peptide ABC transporter [Bacillota bacterium]
AENAYAGQNRPGWRNAKSDELSRAILKELDEKKRIALFHEHQALWSEELPSIPLYFRVDVSAAHKNLQNVKPTGNTTPITWNVQNWSWAN